jgi:hypothetical protein
LKPRQERTADSSLVGMTKSLDGCGTTLH